MTYTLKKDFYQVSWALDSHLKVSIMQCYGYKLKSFARDFQLKKKVTEPHSEKTSTQTRSVLPQLPGTHTYNDHDSLRNSYSPLSARDPGNDSSQNIQDRCDILGLTAAAVCG